MDLKYALRRLAKNPAFFATACVSLALGIGANTAAFSVVYAVLLRSLPVRDPASLAVVSTRYTGFKYSMSYPAYTYLRHHSSSLDGVVAFRAQSLNVSAGGTTERVTGMLVSGNYFDVLGVGMATGSPIRADDDRVPASGGARGLVAVLSHQYWKRRFNSDAAIVGSSVRINGHPLTIVGVAPPRFHGTRVGSLPDVFVPMMFAAQIFDGPNSLANPRNNWLRIIARTTLFALMGRVCA
jgi:putative ABC transport system permease protein